jgi:hypothetical protein
LSFLTRKFERIGCPAWARLVAAIFVFGAPLSLYLVHRTLGDSVLGLAVGLSYVGFTMGMYGWVMTRGADLLRKDGRPTRIGPLLWLVALPGVMASFALLVLVT